MFRPLIISILTVVLSGCGAAAPSDVSDATVPEDVAQDALKTGPENISNATLTGSIGGAPWTFSAGWGPSEADRANLRLYSAAGDTCGDQDASQKFVTVQVPLLVGTYDLGGDSEFEASIVIQGEAGSTDRPVVAGTLVVHEVDGATVKAGVFVFSDADNQLSGQFTGSVCKGIDE